MAVETKRAPIVEIALDCVQAMIAHKLLSGPVFSVNHRRDAEGKAPVAGAKKGGEEEEDGGEEGPEDMPPQAQVWVYDVGCMRVIVGSCCGVCGVVHSCMLSGLMLVCNSQIHNHMWCGCGYQFVVTVSHSNDSVPITTTPTYDKNLSLSLYKPSITIHPPYPGIGVVVFV